MPRDRTKTLVPLTDGFGLDTTETAPFPSLKILFHSDLDRIGETTAPGVLALDEPLSIGRDQPLFCDASGRLAGLRDPCISREQLRVTYHPSGFSVAAVGARGVRTATLDGQPLCPETLLEPGSVIAIGDRVLLQATLRREDSGEDNLELVGDSEPIWVLREAIRAAAMSSATVLIHGGSGVGKELVARSLHRASARGRDPELVVNCAAIPEALLEDELFGHVRGAFTGATDDKRGLFEAARGGTLLLDEIGELPLALQGKLLRALQERRIRPVGAVVERPFDARILAATNRDLRQETAAGRFREDLYYRLTALTIEVPPLRSRREDIPLLLRTLLSRQAEDHASLRQLWREPTAESPPLPLSLVESLLGYDWPGNVRQLENVVERLALANLCGRRSFIVPQAVLAELATRTPTSARPPISGLPSTSGSPSPSGLARRPGSIRRSRNVRRAAAPPPSVGRPPAVELDDQELLVLLEANDYVQRRVARVLGVSTTTIDRRMRQLGVRRPRDLDPEEIAEAAQQADNDPAAMARLLRVSCRGLKLRLRALDRASHAL